MSLHVFGAIVTHHGTAANNRAENEGNITTLQKLLWFGRVHSSVSAEAIRFAIRRRLGEHEETNRHWVESEQKPFNAWNDGAFEKWAAGESYIDDDVLGFMSADAAKEENNEESTTDGPKRKAKGTAKVRRSPLEVTRAISLCPFGGDVTFNAASPGATPSAARKDEKKGAKGSVADVKNPVPYGTEVHATRYQYGFALTPGSLRKPERAAIVVQAICALGEVAGNHGRFLYDFSPESAVFRITHDPAPRLLYVFDEDKKSHALDAPDLLSRVQAGDIPGSELIVAGGFARSDAARELAALGATLEPGVRNAAKLVCDRISTASREA